MDNLTQECKRATNALDAIVKELQGLQGRDIRLKDILEYHVGIKITSAESKRIIKNRG